MFLDRNELIHLTGRTRKDAQVRVLRFMGIEHRLRPDGSVAVLRSHVEKSLGGEESSKQERVYELNLAAFH